MKVYLGGPMNNCTDEEMHGWRDKVEEVLSAKGYECFDPTDRDYRGVELTYGIAEIIVQCDTDDIEFCDIALFNCYKPSWGTAMEIVYANQFGKQVVIVLPVGVSPSPWLVYHGNVYNGNIIDIAETL